MEQDIKIIISGTKGGAQTLCTNFERSEHDSLAYQTAPDYRKFFIIEIPGTKVWGITFAENYKVYMAYYSLFEPGATRTGGYIAINLYIPHDKQSGDPFALIDRLMNRYLERYTDSVTKQMLPKNVSIDDFNDILNSEQLQTSLRTLRYVSKPGDIAIHVVNSGTEIGDIFKNPYRPELKNWNRVFFIEKSVFDNPDVNRAVRNLKSVDPIKINELEKGVRLRSKYEISSLIVNGEKISNSKIQRDTMGYYYDEVFAEDSYNVILFRQYYKARQLTGNVSYTVQKELLLEKYYNQSEWIPKQVEIEIDTSPAKPSYFLLKIGGKDFKEIIPNRILVDEVLVADPFTLFAVEKPTDTNGDIIAQDKKIENNKIIISDLYKIVIQSIGFSLIEKVKIKVDNNMTTLSAREEKVFYYKGNREPLIEVTDDNYMCEKVGEGKYEVKKKKKSQFPINVSGTNVSGKGKGMNMGISQSSENWEIENLKQKLVKSQIDRESDKKGFKKLMKILLFSFIVLTLLAFVGGYLFGKSKAKKVDSESENSGKTFESSSGENEQLQQNIYELQVKVNQLEDDTLDKSREIERLKQENIALKQKPSEKASVTGNKNSSQKQLPWEKYKDIKQLDELAKIYKDEKRTKEKEAIEDYLIEIRSDVNNRNEAKALLKQTIKNL